MAFVAVGGVGEDFTAVTDDSVMIQVSYDSPGALADDHLNRSFLAHSNIVGIARWGGS